MDISIHALREEGDLWFMASFDPLSLFLSTPSARRATKKIPILAQSGRISIHALREEGDASGMTILTSRDLFLSTPSARRATLLLLHTKPYSVISIHALREEGDHQNQRQDSTDSDFYPRPPRGGRRVQPSPAARHHAFLSTPSARRATQAPAAIYCRWKISIHALREEGDSKNRDKISIFKQIIQHSARI